MVKRILLGLIVLYQRAISPYLGRHCRFVPTCSEYAKEAIERYGFKGVVMAAHRVLRCHPGSKGGYDPVR